MLPSRRIRYRHRSLSLSRALVYCHVHCILFLTMVLFMHFRYRRRLGCGRFGENILQNFSFHILYLALRGSPRKKSKASLHPFLFSPLQLDSLFPTHPPSPSPPFSGVGVRSVGGQMGDRTICRSGFMFRSLLGHPSPLCAFPTSPPSDPEAKQASSDDRPFAPSFPPVQCCTVVVVHQRQSGFIAFHLGHLVYLSDSVHSTSSLLRRGGASFLCRLYKSWVRKLSHALVLGIA